MKVLLLTGLLFMGLFSSAQTDTTKHLRAFPITDYIIVMNDSVKLVQIQLPDGMSIKEKQIGILYGVYSNGKEEAVEKGYGRCNLIKRDYYYFTIGHNKSGLSIKKGDLLYIAADKQSIYFGQVPQIAAHYIRLQNVYEEPLFDPYSVFSNWTAQDEEKLIDSIVADIRFTGKYFSENNPSMDVAVNAGEYKGKKTFYVMTVCESRDVKNFLSYMIARPRLYAGHDWKISELFATWVSEGAPAVTKD